MGFCPKRGLCERGCGEVEAGKETMMMMTMMDFGRGCGAVCGAVVQWCSGAVVVVYIMWWCMLCMWCHWCVCVCVCAGPCVVLENPLS